MSVVAKIMKQGKVVKVAKLLEIVYHQALCMQELIRSYTGNGYEPPNNICSSIITVIIIIDGSIRKTGKSYPMDKLYEDVVLCLSSASTA